jgi:hypothetical protein
MSIKSNSIANKMWSSDVDINMTDKDNIKTIWLILALKKKKFEQNPYGLSSSELQLLKLYDTRRSQNS